ncbi:MAG TPA: NADH-quinone oxidoreductase subunit M [Methylomirabilota bacterium]|nr:NADH-quinone oxidoreductase subunit M [Methylomirabilota bacterium]
MNGLPLLTLLTLTPLVGAAVVAGLDSRQRSLARALGLFFNALALGGASLLWWRFDAASGALQFVERHVWIPSVGVEYFLGIDGLGLLMVLLTALIVPFGLLAPGGGRRESAHSGSEDQSGLTSAASGDAGSPAFVSLLLFLQAGLFGAFTALNFIHWFLFYELTLVPAYFLIKLWGGSRRSAAANQFFLYTMVGSVALLLSMLAVYLVTGSFDFIKLAESGRSGELASLFNVRIAGWYDLSPRALALVIFFGAFLGFAVKVPVWPFHTWLPATYAEAPTGVSMVLTGVMSKLGVYGFLRILLPIFPNEMQIMLTPLLWLAVATIVFSAWAAMMQKDLKRIVAYSSINHLGYCLLGVFAVASFTGSDPKWTTEKAAALNGVIVQMFNHGITASALFYFVGLIEQRAGRRGLDDFGGLRKVAPVFAGLMGIALFASLGLPGLNGFIGEFLIFKGVFALAGWAAALSVLGLLTTAIFLLNILQRVWSGPMDEQWTGFRDLSLRERLVVLGPIALMFVLGVWPQLVLGFTNPTVLQFVERLKL